MQPIGCGYAPLPTPLDKSYVFIRLEIWYQQIFDNKEDARKVLERKGLETVISEQWSVARERGR
jgi:hypothetical protein